MEGKTPITPSDVAAWMVSEFNRNQVLFHDIAACRIQEQFGTEFTHLTEDGSFSIQSSVLLAFRTMTKDTVVWERQKRYWRKRTDCDEDGRSQDSKATEITQLEQDVSFFLTTRAGQYLCDKCISELTGIMPSNRVRQFITNPSSGHRGAGGQTLFCHRVKAKCVRCCQKRTATAYISAMPTSPTLMK